jgi:hypothetical protein
MKDYIIYIKPEIQNNKMIDSMKDLNRRMADVSQKFGKGLEVASKQFNANMNTGTKKTIAEWKSGLNFGAQSFLNIFNGVSMAFSTIQNLMQRVVRPFESLDKNMNEQLSSADNIMTKSEQYGTTGAKYLRTSMAFGKSGINEDVLDLMLLNYREKIAQAKIDVKEGKQNPLENYIQFEDSLDGMLRLLNEFQKIGDKDIRDKSIIDIFGIRQAKVTGELMDTPLEDLFKEVNKRILPYSDKKINKNLSKLANLEDIQAFNNEQLKFSRLMKGAETIDVSNINSQASLQAEKDKNMYSLMGDYNQLVEINKKLDKIQNITDKFMIQSAKNAEDVIDKVGGFFYYLSPILDKIRGIGDLLNPTRAVEKFKDVTVGAVQDMAKKLSDIKGK